jgi:hypothetical protein
MKRGLSRVMLVFALCVAAVLWASLPAFAKGPSQAILEGPGISSPIAVRDPGAPTIGPELAALVTDSGLFTGLACRTCDDRLRHRPTGELGLRYTVTYTMGSGSNEVVQYVFPYAAPDPVTYVPAGQRFYRGSTVGGWFIARPRLHRLLIDLGVPAEEASLPPVGVRDPIPDGASATRTLFPVTAALGIFVALVVALRRLRRRPTDVRA